MADVTERIAREASGILTEGERILAVAPQAAVNSPLKRDSAIVTTRRLILFRPKLFGRMDLEDFLWQDVTDVGLSTKLLGATLSVTATRRDPGGAIHPRTGVVDGLDKKAALRVYAEAQRLEQEWREKNRVRQMEEERARAGGVYLGGAGSAGAPLAASSGGRSTLSVEERLARLEELHGKGLLTDAEYESRKGQIIAEL